MKSLHLCINWSSFAASGKRGLHRSKYHVMCRMVLMDGAKVHFFDIDILLQAGVAVVIPGSSSMQYILKIDGIKSINRTTGVIAIFFLSCILLP